MILADFAEAVVAKKPNTLLTSSSNLRYMKDNMKLECCIKWCSGLLKSWHFSYMIEYAKILANKKQHSGWRINLFVCVCVYVRARAKYEYVSWFFPLHFRCASFSYSIYELDADLCISKQDINWALKNERRHAYFCTIYHL